jgi:type II secretion system protein H
MRHSSFDRRIEQQGFTLVEMMVVLAVVALMTAIALPMIGRGRVEGAPDSIVRDLQSMFFAARIKALAQGHEQRIEFDLDKRSIGGAGRTIHFGEGLQADLLIGQELLAADGSAALLFFADGGSTGAKFTLTDQRNRSSRIVVSWLTGIPMIQDGGDD